MNNYYWCYKCEHTFNKNYKYNGKRVLLGERGGFWCPHCGASPTDTLDWDSFIFGPAYSNNYPIQPIDGHYYPLYPTI